MDNLKHTARSIYESGNPLPFSIYSSVAEQRLLNIPIIKPLLICVLSGQKELGQEVKEFCQPGEFVFLSNTPNIDMRNITQGTEYFALLINFEYEDFDVFTHKSDNKNTYFKGSISTLLQRSIEQFVQWADYAPKELWSARRKELLLLIHHLGFDEVSSIAAPPSLTHQVEQMVSEHILDDFGAEQASSMLAVSDSTLRRKLANENTNFQAIKDRVKLGHGLHLLQSTNIPIGLVAEQCGYHSQSRFTDKFKSLFGLTPSQLRKTRTK